MGLCLNIDSCEKPASNERALSLTIVTVMLWTPDQKNGHSIHWEGVRGHQPGVSGERSRRIFRSYSAPHTRADLRYGRSVAEVSFRARLTYYGASRQKLAVGPHWTPVSSTFCALFYWNRCKREQNLKAQTQMGGPKFCNFGDQV